MNAQKSPKPIGVKAPHGQIFFEISWDNGKTHRLENEILRGFCPCAGCQGHSGAITFQKDKNSQLRDIRQVGNYALSLVWGDRHDTGIYSFDYLYRLGELVEQVGSAALIAGETIKRAQVLAAGAASADSSTASDS